MKEKRRMGRLALLLAFSLIIGSIGSHVDAAGKKCSITAKVKVKVGKTVKIKLKSYKIVKRTRI